MSPLGKLFVCKVGLEGNKITAYPKMLIGTP